MKQPLGTTNDHPDARFLRPHQSRGDLGARSRGIFVKPGIVVKRGGVSLLGTRVISRATPDAQSSLPDWCQSDTANTYDGTTYAKKIIVRFSAPITLDVTDRLFVTGYASSAGSQMDWVVTAGTGIVQFMHRVRAALNRFAIDEVTWNNYSSKMTLGADYVWNSQTIDFVTASVVGSHAVYQGSVGGMHCPVTYMIAPGILTTIWGFVLDGKIATGGTLAVSSAQYMLRLDALAAVKI